MRADLHPACQREADHAVHDRRIAGVKAAGDVGGRHQRQHRRVIAHAPGAVALRKIGVQIDHHVVTSEDIGRSATSLAP